MQHNLTASACFKYRSQVHLNAASASAKMISRITHSCRLASAQAVCMSFISNAWRRGLHARRSFGSPLTTKWSPIAGKRFTANSARPSMPTIFRTLLLRANGLVYLRFQNQRRTIWSWSHFSARDRLWLDSLCRAGKRTYTLSLSTIVWRVTFVLVEVTITTSGWAISPSQDSMLT